MTMHDDLESTLVGAFAFTPSADGLRRLDDRVARAMAQPVATQPVAAQRRGLFTSRSLLRPLALVAAFVLLTGAVAGALTLLERLAGDAPFGLRTAWERAEVLGIAQEDAGITVTLERAYADLNQVVVFLEVEGLAAPASGGAGIPIDMVAQLRDPAGRVAEEWASSLGGRGDASPELAASIMSWDGAVLAEAGIWTLTVGAVGYDGMSDGAMTDGTWRFEFPMPKPAGTILSTDVSATAGDATISLTELRVAPSMVAGRLHLQVGDSVVTAWGATLSAIRHNGEPWSPGLDPNYVGDPLGDAGFEFRTSAGADIAAGTWEIEISSASYQSSPYGPTIEVQGPWTLTVVVP